MNITIIGAGNLGLACCGMLAQKNNVTLYTLKAHSEEVTFRVEYEGEWRPDVTVKVTDSLEAACQSELILCTYPAFLRQQFVASIEPYVHPGTLLGFIPGYGGVEYYCQGLLEKGAVVFGFQRVPYVSRSSWDERLARVLSAKTNLYVAALPASQTESIARLIEGLFSIPTTPLKEFLAITLAPSNPLLHTCGAYGILKDYAPGETYPAPLKFYEEWNDETSRLLLAFDDELQRICAKLAPLDLQEVVPLREYYESPTPEQMTQKLKSIRAFEAVMAPLREEEGSYVPNWYDRMFAEDYPYGVAIIKDIALLVDEPTPAIDTLLRFYERNTGAKYFTEEGELTEEALTTGAPRAYGLDTKEKLIDFYRL